MGAGILNCKETVIVIHEANPFTIRNDQLRFIMLQSLQGFTFS